MHVSVPAQSARARSRQVTRRRLLRSARTLFSSRGLHGVTSHEIARGAGVAAGTFYLYFKDKESVFREIVYDAIERLRERLKSARESAPDGRAAIRAHAEAMVTFAEEHRDLVRIVFGRDHGAASLEADVLDYLASVGAGILRERMAAGTFSTRLDAQVAAQALTGMFTRVIAWWIEDSNRAPRQAIVDALVEIQLNGTYSYGFRPTNPGDTEHRKTE
jgi:AcrR family transcriptional regulator